MTNLERKIRDIIIQEGGDGSDYAIRAINQAFIDDGYLSPRNKKLWKEIANAMTGAEWFNRFENELESTPARIDQWIEAVPYKAAARRAAGLGDSDERS